MRKPLLVLAALAALAVPAIAQIAPVRIIRPVEPPPQVQAIQITPQDQQLTFDVTNDPERAKALIAKLRAKNRELRGQMALTLGDLQSLRTQLDEITRAGGSMVRAQCVSASLSRRTDGGGEENCAASGYMCASVEGTCHRQCTTSNMCAPGFLCDTSVSRCVPPPRGDDE